MRFRKTRHALLGATTIGLCIAAPGAYAQSASPAGEAAGNAGGAEIVVTGSRITRRDYQSSTPVATLDQSQLQRSGAVTVEATLNQMPQFVASTGAANAFPSAGGQAHLNLRGLGNNRALVLLDGRRIQPSTPDGIVDVNVVPVALISQVETITGGASSTYGSDAMSGVVNFKLRDDFSGLQVDAQTGGSFLGDANNREISLVLGSKLADDRGSAVFAFDYSTRDELVRADRTFFNPSVVNGRLPYPLIGLAGSPPTANAVDTVFGQYGVAAGTVRPAQTFGVNPDGTLFTPAPGSGPVINYRGQINSIYFIRNNVVSENLGATYDLQSPLTRYSSYGKVKYNLSPDVQAFAVGLFTHYTSDAQGPILGTDSAGTVITVPVTNPFIPADLRTLLASRASPNAPFTIGAQANFLGPIHSISDTDIWQLTAGLNGKFADGNWSWGVFGYTGETSILQKSTAMSKSALQTLLAASDGGASLCAGGLNLFTNQFNVSDACRAYVARTTQSTSKFKQSGAEADLQGTIFRLPAGEVKLAVGGEYRSRSYEQVPDALLHAPTSDIVGFATALPASGSDNVKELYGELLVPLIHDTPLIEKLELNLGYRWSDYSTIGSVSTYKADADWTVTKGIRVRGGYARAIRAPSLGELYSPPLSTSATIGTASAGSFTGDPCDIRSGFRQSSNPNASQVRALCLTQGVPAAAIDSFINPNNSVFTSNQGNPNLAAETADTFSAGVVIQSPLSGAFSRMSLSVDYYNITIKGAIGTLPFTTALAQCFNSNNANPNFSADNANCQGISRVAGIGNLAGGISTLRNLGAYKTDGIDVALDWTIDLADLGLKGDPGSLSFNLAGTYVRKMSVQTLPGTAPLDFAGTTSSGITSSSGISNVLPKWKHVANLGYTKGPFSFGVRWRYIGKLTDSSKVTNPSSTVPGVPAYSYFDLSSRIRVNEQFELRMGINNVADKDPPLIGTSPGNTDFNTYDVLGRMYYIGVRVRL